MSESGFRFGEDREDTRTSDGGSIRHFPRFEYGYSLDDLRRPSEVTIFDDRDASKLDVRWMTVDKDHAVPLEEIR